MRMRFKPYARPELLACPFHVHEPPAHKNGWHALYARPEQLFQVELGCGKGGFISQLAPQHPEINYLGVDMTDKVLILAKRKVEAAYAAKGLIPDNVRLCTFDIERMAGILGEKDVIDRLYINFCNPWSKNSGSKKHRLTHGRQLMLYRDYLRDGGEVWFKTDDEALYNDTLRYLPLCGYAITWQTRDLHAEEPAWNLRTEHEGMFTEQEIPIKALIAQKRPDAEGPFVWTKALEKAIDGPFGGA